MNLVKFFMDEEVKVEEVVAVPEPVVEEVAVVVEEKLDEEVVVEVPQVAETDEGLVISPNTTASPVDIPLNISA